MSSSSTKRSSGSSRRTRAVATRSAGFTKMVGIPSAAATASNRAGSPGSARFSTSMMAVESIEVRAASRPRSGRHPLLVDLFLELDDPVDERLGPGRAAGHEDVDRNDLVDALDDGVVVEHA